MDYISPVKSSWMERTYVISTFIRKSEEKATESSLKKRKKATKIQAFCNRSRQRKEIHKKTLSVKKNHE